jgi:hypothetical protein
VPLFKKQPTPFQRIVPIQFLHKLGPGLITGASDDDPSGIGTYSQAGAQLGYSIGWTMLLTYPLMVAIQEISARIGRTTGHGISGNLCRQYPSWLLHLIVTLLFIANTINIGADLSSMADAARVLFGGGQEAEGDMAQADQGIVVLSAGAAVRTINLRSTSQLRQKFRATPPSRCWPPAAAATHAAAAPSIKEAPIMNATITALRLASAAASRDLVIICATRFSASGAASPVRISTKRTR